MRDDAFTPPVTGLYLEVPFLLHHSVVPKDLKPYYLSFEQNKDAPVIPKKFQDQGFRE